MELQCDVPRFQHDIATHVMQIIRDDGVYRHLRFKRPDTTCYYFDLITWPGHLCYTGDMGTYVFERLHDMFDFFRRRPDHLYGIDFNYWAEKCTAGDKSSMGDGIREYSHEMFLQNVRQYVASHEEADRPDPEEDGAEQVRLHAEAYAELRAAVEDEVCSCDDNGVRAYDAANDFHHDGAAWTAFASERHPFQFIDFWDHDNEVYTFRFLWCCYALSWAIHQYDLTKAAKPVEANA